MKLKELRLIAEASLEQVKAERIVITDHIESVVPFLHGTRRGPHPDFAWDEYEHAQAVLRWAEIGCPTFHVEPDALGAGLLTDCSGLGLEDLKLPFHAFALALPSPNPLHMIGARGEPVEIGTLLMHEYRTDVDPSSGVAVIDSRRKAQGLTRTTRTYAIVAIARVGTGSLFTRAEVTEGQVAGWLGLGAAYGSHPHRAIPLEHMDTVTIAASVKVAVNMMLYVNTLRAQGKLLDEPVRTRERRKGEAHSRSWTLPGPIKLSPELRAAVFADPEASAVPKWKLAHRYVVRGHWRNQPCGKGLSERRLTWVAPYWKGPDEAAVLDRTYHVEA